MDPNTNIHKYTKFFLFYQVIFLQVQKITSLFTQIFKFFAGSQLKEYFEIRFLVKVMYAVFIRDDPFIQSFKAEILKAFKTNNQKWKVQLRPLYEKIQYDLDDQEMGSISLYDKYSLVTLLDLIQVYHNNTPEIEDVSTSSSENEGCLDDSFEFEQKIQPKNFISLGYTLVELMKSLDQKLD